MRRLLITLLLASPLLGQAPNGWAPIENGWAEIQTTAPTGTVTTTGTLASGQVALGSGATSVTSNDGLTHQGSGTTFKLGIGTDVFLSRASAGLLLVEDGSGAARDVQARTGTFDNLSTASFVKGTSYLQLFAAGVASDISFGAANDTMTWRVNAAGGALTPDGTTNLRDLGSVTKQVRTGYFGTSIYSPLFSVGPPSTGTNIAGTTTTVAGQLGTGSGASGDQVFMVGTPQASGTGQHVAATALTLHNAGTAGTAAPQAVFADGTAAVPTITFASDTATGFYKTGGNAVGLGFAGGQLVNFIGGMIDMSGGATLRLRGYTVATLPAGTVGDTAYVTDATAPTYLGALTGGGAVVVPVFYNGAAWVSH